MASYFDEQINKHTDWGGDSSTGGIPVIGKRVQEFIKGSLNSKIGYLYYNGEKYLCFTDEEACEKYLTLDPASEEAIALLLGSFDAPANYEASISMLTPLYNAVSLTSKNNVISFTAKTTNKEGQDQVENIICTYTFYRGSNKKSVTYTYSSGATINFNIDDYLLEGDNTINIKISGQTTLATTSISIKYNVVDLQFNDRFDISTCITSIDGSQYLEIPFTISGYGTKTIEWYLDGIQVTEDPIVDIINTPSDSRTRIIPIGTMYDGLHSLQMRAYTIVNEERFYSDILYREFIVSADPNTIEVLPTIACKVSDIVTSIDKLIISELTQYSTYNLNLAGYNSLNTKMNTSVFINEDLMGTLNMANGEVYNLSIVTSKAGMQTLNIVIGENTRSISLNIASTDKDIDEILNGLVFDFRAIGKSNDATDKDQWSYGDYSASFTGFNWNESSGWVNNRLRLSAGSIVNFGITPLSNTFTDLGGKTFEIEFNSRNVTDNNLILCDLRTNGVGILITASTISITSRGNVVLTQEYKSDENTRFSIVVNPKEGVTNKRLVLIYINGIVSGGISYAENDSFTSNAEMIFKGYDEAGIDIKHIRIYNRPLSSDDVLNNYMLYQDSALDMSTIYDRNDVYYANTSTFNPDVMASRLPVMIVTGDIPTLEATTNKDTQIVVDVEYINLQDSTKNFKMVNAAMRPQGTSSMNYPKKNFRIYTRKLDDTIVYDYQNKVIEDKLYSFNVSDDGKLAQPVDCWCLKADFAESSGTHNTGIARLWNKVLYNADVNTSKRVDPTDPSVTTPLKGNLLRTNAQRIAKENDYPYDVRTTIDGFPILLFYRLNPTDDLIFIGKYNFNNDKSTESVFGFEGIEGFDNSRMQCWEVLNNGHPYALFTNVDKWYDTQIIEGEVKYLWEEAFESRYPDDGHDADTTDLYNFCSWLSEINKNFTSKNTDVKQQALTTFQSQKWNHLDVPKVAAYYIYLMRFGAVDQTVKNSMLTSEDGEHFYFINYDNDTINGLINTGVIGVPTDADRQTINPAYDATDEDSLVYIYAGHDSALWNLLEADDEFMQIVKNVDDALYTAGLTYTNVIDIFDNQQANKWCERVYNQDAQYKYIGPFVNNSVNNLAKMQGSRLTHRRYWLSRRFALYDSLFVSGDYKTALPYFKVANDTKADGTYSFDVTAGTNLYYGYIVNNIPVEVGVHLDKNASHTFALKRPSGIAGATFAEGDPISICGPGNIKALDLTNVSERLKEFNLVASDQKSTEMSLLQKLVLGNPTTANNVLNGITVTNAPNLKYLDITNLKAITSVDLTNQIYLEELHASKSGLTGVSFKSGANLKVLELPSSMISLDLKDHVNLTASNIKFDNNDLSNVISINITGCPKVTNDFSLVDNWFTNKISNNNECELVLDNVNWVDVDPAKLIELSRLGTLSLKGEITIVETENPDLYAEQLTQLRDIYGENVFSRDSELYIKAPAAVIVLGRTEILEGESEQYEILVFGGEITRVNYSISGYLASITKEGLLTTAYANITRQATITAIAIYTTDEGVVSAASKQIIVNVKARTYPSVYNSSIEGALSVNDNNVYKFKCINEYTGEIRLEWLLSGDITNNVRIKESNDTQCVLEVIENTIFVEGILQCFIYRNYDNAQLFTVSKTINLSDDTVAEVDPGIVAAFKAAYPELIEHDNYITKEEALIFTAEMLQPGTSYTESIFYNYKSQIKSFNGFKYFTNILTIKPYTFSDFLYLESIQFPPSLKTIEENVFYNWSQTEHPKLKYIEFPESLESIGNNAFNKLDIGVVIKFNSKVNVSTGTIFSISARFPDVESVPSAFITLDYSNVEFINTPKNAVWFNCSYYAGSASINTYSGVDVCVNGHRVETLTVDNDICDFAYSCMNIKKLVVADTVNSVGQGIAHYSKIEEFEGKFAHSSGKFLVDGETLLSTACVWNTDLVIPEDITRLKFYSVSGIQLEDKNLVIKNITSLEGKKSSGSSYQYANIYQCKFNNAILLSNIETNADDSYAYNRLKESISAGLFSGTKANKIILSEQVLNLRPIKINSCYEIEIQGYTTEIPASFSSQNYELTKVTFANAHNIKLGSYAFYMCSKLKELDTSVISEFYLQSLRETGLSNIVISDNAKLGQRCLYSSVSIPRNISIGKNVQPLDSSSYSPLLYCAGTLVSESSFERLLQSTAFSNITFRNTTDVYGNIGSYANYLTNLTLEGNIKTIKSSAFKDCTALATIEIVPSISRIELDAFRNMHALKSVKIQDLESWCKIGFDTAYANPLCNGGELILNGVTVTTLNIPETIENIGSNSFYKCNSITSVNIPDTVKTVGYSAFGECVNLNTVVMGSGISKLDEYAFYGCVNLGTIKISTVNAPTTYTTTFGVSSSTYTGVATSGENVLYVPAESTGYEESYWLDPLCNSTKCGFTLSKTL